MWVCRVAERLGERYGGMGYVVLFLQEKNNVAEWKKRNREGEKIVVLGSLGKMQTQDAEREEKR